MANQAVELGIPVSQGQPVNWKTGTCDCCEDVPLCCLTCWCPCITFGRIANIVDRGKSSCCVTGAVYGLLYSFTTCQCFYSCSYRTKMRQEFNIVGDQLGDFCTHFWCERCALTQMARELSLRNFDVPGGWHESMALGVNMAPTAPVGMTR